MSAWTKTEVVLRGRKQGLETEGEEEAKVMSWVLSSPNYGSKRKGQQAEMIYPELTM